MAAGDPGSPARYYSSTAVETALSGSIPAQAQGAANTSFIVATVSGFPSSYPYTLIVDPDTSKEEVVTVTAGSGTTLSVTRGSDNTQGVAHSAGAVVRHGVSGRDFRESETHIAARGYDVDQTILDLANQTHVHGIVTTEGVVVGTLKTQTLTNKTLTSPTITNPSISGAGVDASIVFEGTTADAYETTLTVVDPTQDNTITMPNTTGTVVIATAVQTLTNKTIDMTGKTITGLSSAGMVASSATPKDYVDAILGSATAAATSAASAATSATSAATSATSAAASATASAASASASATSATAAATSATSAAASATAAATSATSAAASATTAAASVATIAGYATASANSASAAATSATSAAASATAASTSASSALTSQTAAATSATSAAASATAAATSATSAAASATAAATSATSAAASATTAASYVVPPQTGNAGKVIVTDGTTTSWSTTINGTAIPSTKTLVVTTDKLSALAATTSAELAGVISDETGTGALVFANTPTLVTPALGSATGTSLALTVASGTTVPLTIQNNGTGDSFVVNDVASDTTPFVVDQSGNVAVGNTLSVGSLATVGGSTPNTGTALIANAQAFLNSTVNWNYGNLEIRRNASNTTSPRFIDMILDGDSAESTTIGATNSIWGIYDSAPTTGSLSSTLNAVMVYGAYAGHRWYTNGTERMRIATTGIVGIGTTPSGAMLHIVNNTAGNVGTIIKGAASQTADLLQVQNSAATELFTIDSAGKVGIGASSPAGKLHTVLTSGYSPGGVWDTYTAVFATGGTNTSGGVGISYDDTTGAQISSIIPGVSWKPVIINADSIKLNYAGTNIGVALTTAGLVGIGTSTPTAKLDVNGSINSTNLSASNSIINGAFDISQRGATITGINTDNTYTADRWYITRGGSIDYAQKTVAGGSTPPATFDAYAQYINQSAANPFVTIGQTLETKDSIRFAGQSVTFSFYARAAANTAKSKSIQASITYNTTADTKTNTSISETTFAINYGTTAGDWTRCTVTQTVPSTAKSVGVRFLSSPSGGLAVGDGYEITGVQLEVGSVATPFNRTGGTIQGELAACQRYYWRQGSGEAFGFIASGFAISTTDARGAVQYPVPMRTHTVTTDFSNLMVWDGTTITAVTGVTGGYLSQRGSFMQFAVASGLTNFRPYVMMTNNNTAGYLGVSAEL